MNSVLPIEILIDIAEYDYRIYGAFYQSCREIHNAFSAVDPWKLFTVTKVNKTSTSMQILNVFKNNKTTHTCIYYNSHGPINSTICLYKQSTCKATINIMYVDAVFNRYRITFHYPDRNELIWRDAEYCRRLVACYGAGDHIQIH